MKIRKKMHRLISAVIVAVMLVTAFDPVAFAEDLNANVAGGEYTSEETQTGDTTLEMDVPDADGTADQPVDNSDDIADSTGPQNVSEDNGAEAPEQTLFGAYVYIRREEQETPVKDILVRLYDADTYQEDSDSNLVVAEMTTEEDGRCRFENLPKGNYRVEYIDKNQDFQAEAYRSAELLEDADYEVTLAEDEQALEEAQNVEVKEREYFACVKNISLQETRELGLELVEKESEDSAIENTEDVSDHQPSTTVDTELEDPENQKETTAGTELEDEADEQVEAEDTPNNADASEPIDKKQLKNLDETVVGASFEEPRFNLFRMLRSAVTGSNWSFDAYYVNQDDKYYVEKTGDFNLKYQMEFHNSQDLPENSVEIRIPAELFKDRDGNTVVPTDIGVPEGTVEHPVSSRMTPFNYYIDEQTGELVFFNYDKIASGSNAAWQVLYKNLKLMNIVDETEWSLTPKITVKYSEESEAEEMTTKPLTGMVDSSVTLSSVSKTPYYESDKNYTPGLYTESQVEKYIQGSLPDRYTGDAFQNYKFVVWDVKIKGSATQAWDLQLKDVPTTGGITGEVVGYRNHPTKGYERSVDDTRKLSSENYSEDVITDCREESWGSRFWVVTAYPADQIQEGNILENDISVQLVPHDGKDDPQIKDDTDKWSYIDYKWDYKGHMIGIGKDYDEKYNGWLEVYKHAKDRGEDYGSFPFRTLGIFRGYELTHSVKTEDGKKVGQYIDGKSYKLSTVDDFMYVYPSDGTDAMVMDDKDYYFNGVTITQTDVGYDVWEDKETAPEAVEGIDQKIEIYAMFEGKDTWEWVAEVPWNSSGILSYTFDEATIAKKPWRVKVDHQTINYSTVCNIDVNVCIKHNSPVMEEVLRRYNEGTLQEVKLEDISGVFGGEYKDYTQMFMGYCQDQGTGDGTYNYDEPGLEEATKDLYRDINNPDQGILLMRNNAFKTVTGLGTSAASYKNAKSTNDAVNGRVLVDYCLTAFDGYEIYGQEGVNYLKGAGVQSPGRNEVVFYDLLPYGMRFDPSQKVTAGRITNLTTDTYKTQPKSWDRSQVTVTVDSKKDIIENYNGTGRTMVVFHIKYDGADSAVYTEQKWMEGWGVSFRGYYDWKDLEIVQDGVNISAFMPEDSPGSPLYGKPLYGTENEVACDDGVIVPAGFEEDYKDFGKDINRDNITDIRNVLYARAVALEDMALANSSGITKLVRADSDRFGVYGKSAVVEVGGGYTYDITVSNADSSELRNIVVYDRLENAAEDRGNIESETFYPFNDGSWYGTFQSVVTKGLEEMGISPKIYYNTERSAAISENNEDPAGVLTEANGWYEAGRFEEANMSLSAVKAVAVDLSTKTDGTPFALGNMESVTFQIKMQAPADKPGDGILYAYNNPSFYSYTVETNTPHTVIGNSTRVSMNETETLELVKEFEGEVPETMQGASFEFTLYQESGGKEEAFANQEYQLWRKIEGEWVQQTDRLYATDASGCLSLHADEKAVFPDLPDAGRIQVQETENPFWKVTKTDDTVRDADTGNSIRTITVKNQYRTVLYARKTLEAVPEEVDTENVEFTFQVSALDQQNQEVPLANTMFWYVDSVRTDGGIPSKIKELGKDGVGYTDENGNFTIKEGQIIALFMEGAGTRYQLKEVGGTGKDSDWICQTDTVSGTVPVLGASASITNIYKWKELYLTKSLTHQDPADCTQEFTFRITKIDGDDEIPLAGNEWVVLNEDGTESETKGTITGDGRFTCACAGKTVKIKKLEAGKTYKVKEVDSGENYEPQNDTEEVTMPIYSSKKDVSITNDYKLRPLSVTKIVTYDQNNAEEVEAVKEKSFIMTVKVKGELLKEYPYTLTENGVVLDGTYKTNNQGEFILKNGQAATFEDVGEAGTTFEVVETPDSGYPQIYPAQNGSHKGEIESEGSSVTFVNGTDGGLMLSKEYIGVDQGGKDYVTMMKDPENEEGRVLRQEAAVTMSLKVTNDEGNTYLWPKQDTAVDVIDELTGENATETWPAQGTLSVEPWKKVVIPQSALSGVTSYILTEASEDQHAVFEWKDGTWIEIAQMDPADDAGASGTLEENPVAKIINQATSFTFEGSQIEKRMALGSTEVPEDAELIWRLERYDGVRWNPAGGIPYLIFDGSGAVTDRTLTTEADGRIRLAKTADGYPKVRFTRDKVYLNRYQDAQIGDLRLVELLEESDEAWGVLAGYGTAGNPYGYSIAMSSQYAVAFVNTNRTVPVEIEKKMEHPTDATFTMILKQVLSTSRKPVTKEEQILQSEAVANIEYIVYDSESGEQVGSGVTDKNGAIRLKAGQYARLNLPDGTLWTVSEELKADYTLKNLTGTPADKLTQLNKNLMLIQPKAEVVAALGATGPKRVGVNSTIFWSKFSVYVYYSDGTSKWLTSGYNISPTTANSTAGPMEVTVSWNSGGLKTTVPISVVDTITLTDEMVEQGVINADTGKQVVLKAGDVEIPEFIVWKGAEYQVTGIGVQAFSQNKEITSIKIPSSITSIGREAFYDCSNMSGSLSLGNVSSIGASAFYNCSKLSGGLDLSSVAVINAYTFYGCSGLNKALTLSKNITFIGNGAFEGCSGLTGTPTLSYTITYIGRQAFKDCKGLTGHLAILQRRSDALTIGYGAFMNCTGLTELSSWRGQYSVNVGNYAFAGCTSLETASLSDWSMTKNTFSGCTKLRTLSFEDSIIPDYAFQNCTGLETLTINSSIIGTNAFQGCTKLTTLNLRDVSTIPDYAFQGCKSLRGTLSIPSRVTTIGTNAFAGTNYTSVTINKAQDSITGAPWGMNNPTITWTGN